VRGQRADEGEREDSPDNERWVEYAIADPSIFKLGDRVCAGWAKPLTRPAVFFGRNG
jgi:hypothetical protein